MTWESPASCFSKIMFGQQNLDSGFMSWQGGMGQTCRSEASVHCVIYIDSQSMELYEFLSRVCSLRIDWPKFLFSFCYDMYISHTLGQSLDKSPMLVYPATVIILPSSWPINVCLGGCYHITLLFFSHTAQPFSQGLSVEWTSHAKLSQLRCIEQTISCTPFLDNFTWRIRTSVYAQLHCNICADLHSAAQCAHTCGGRQCRHWR